MKILKDDQITRVLYLSHDGLTDPLGQAQILPYLVGLSAKGYHITIISFEKQEQFSKEKGEVAKLCAIHNLQWFPLTYHNFPPVLSTVYDLFRLKTIVGKTLESMRFSIVHSRSYPVTLVALWAKKKFKTKLVFDMRGFWADERVEGGIWKLSNPVYAQIYRYFKKKEEEFIASADHIVSLTFNARGHINSIKNNTVPVTVIPTCVDMEFFDPSKVTQDRKLQLRTSLGILPGEVVLLYLGSWGTWYQTEEMLRHFYFLKTKKLVSKFLIITRDPVLNVTEQQAHDILIRSASRNEVRDYIAISDVAICFVKPSFSKKASSATKIGEILAMNVPVIVNSGWGDIDLLVDKFPGYIFINNQTLPESFRKQSPKQEEMIRHTVEDVLGLKNGVAAYQEIYRSLA